MKMDEMGKLFSHLLANANVKTLGCCRFETLASDFAAGASRF
jgi:hypothetical protein